METIHLQNKHPWNTRSRSEVITGYDGLDRRDQCCAPVPTCSGLYQYPGPQVCVYITHHTSAGPGTVSVFASTLHSIKWPPTYLKRPLLLFQSIPDPLKWKRWQITFFVARKWYLSTICWEKFSHYIHQQCIAVSRQTAVWFVFISLHQKTSMQSKAHTKSKSKVWRIKWHNA